jgi:branched-chain amino acid transport system ATP-binding protein
MVGLEASVLTDRRTKMAVLEVDTLNVSHDAIAVVHGISWTLGHGEALWVLGPNGAGKTSMLRAISGLGPSFGTIRLAGRRIDGLAAEARVAAGLSHVPDSRGLFLALSVEDNLRLGAHARHDRAEIAGDLDRLWSRFPILRQRRRQQAGTLSGGEQQLLAISRALMARPAVLMIDEPSAGLAPQASVMIHQTLAAIRNEFDVALLIVEQESTGVSALADRVMVLDAGRVVFIGPPADPRCEALLRRALLGRSDP